MRRLLVLSSVAGLLVACVGEGASDTTVSTTSPASTTAESEGTAPTSTTIEVTTTTTLPPTPELVVLGDSLLGWAELGFGPDGLPVVVYATGDSVVLATCDDPHCATEPNLNSVVRLTESTDSSQLAVAQVWDVGFGSTGSVAIAYDTWDLMAGELEGLSQEAVICSDKSCTESISTRIGPMDDPEHPAGVWPLSVDDVLVSPEGRMYLIYDVQNTVEDGQVEFGYWLTECSATTGCVPDVASDRTLYLIPNSFEAIGIDGEATLDDDGAPWFAIGIQLSGQPWRILLAQCDNAACDAPTVSWVSVPVEGKAIRNVDISVGTDGNPLLAYTDFVSAQLNLYLTACHKRDCSEASTFQVATKVRRDWDLTVDGSQTPYLVWGDVDTDEAIIGKCADTSCAGFTTVNTGLTGTEDWQPALAIAPDGYPMVAFTQPPAGLQLFNCLPNVCDPLQD